MTEREHVRAPRNWSEGWLRVFLETAVDAIIVIDARGLIESFNPAAELLFGYRDIDVVGMNVNVLMPPPYAEEHDGYLESFLRTGNKRIIGVGREVEALKADGTVFPVHLSVAELELDGEKRFTGILRDLTEQKRLEAEFLHSQKLEAVGQLAGALAHDFNNLLMGIISGCRMVGRMLGEGSPARELLGEIQKEAHSGAGITRQLLDFSRKRTYTTTEVDLHALVAGSRSMYCKLLGESVEVSVSVDPSGGTVLADPSKLEQILMNLVVNARDAMPRGGRLRIDVANRTLGTPPKGLEPGDFVVLSVDDTGCGMDEATRVRIFEPFFTTKEQGKGTGLGLSTVFGLTTEFGGVVEVETQPDAGTSFRLIFPRIEAEPVPAPSPEVSAGVGGSETILVVEDATLVRAGIRHLLKSLGYTVLDAARPQAALELLEARGASVDLLLTDIVMPGMHGPELAKRVVAGHPGTRVLFMSAFSDADLVQQGRLQSGMPVLEKPFEDEDLARKVREVLDSRSDPTGWDSGTTH